MQVDGSGFHLLESVFKPLHLQACINGYTARYLAKNKDLKIIFKESLVQLWVPVALILMLILPANFSTTAIYIFHDFNCAFIGGYPLKYIGYILAYRFLVLALFILIAKAFPDAMPNRVNTWGNRIENFSNSDGQEAYQVEKAKIAIATGGIVGKGPGKSVQKNFLPQSSSDFIYAIIVEEYGLVGAALIVFVYFLLLFRIFIIVKKATNNIWNFTRCWGWITHHFSSRNKYGSCYKFISCNRSNLATN